MRAALLDEPRICTHVPQNLLLFCFYHAGDGLGGRRRSGGRGAGAVGAADSRDSSPGCPEPAAASPRAVGLRLRGPSSPQTPLRLLLLLARAAKIMHFLESGRVHFPLLICIQSFAAPCQMLTPESGRAAEAGARSLPFVTCGARSVGSSKIPCTIHSCL